MATQEMPSAAPESVISPMPMVPGGFDDETDMFEDANAATPLQQEKKARQPDQSPVRSLTGNNIPPQTAETPDTQVVIPLEKLDTKNTVPQTNSAEVSPTSGQPKADASHRLSTTSLSSVKLGEDAESDNNSTSPTGEATPDNADIQAFAKMAAADSAPVPESEETRPEVPTRTSGRGWFGSQSTLPTVAPAVPAKDSKNDKPQPALLARKTGGPFSWLTSRKSEQAPPPRNPSPGTGRQRGMTTSSVATLHSNPDLMINTLDGVAENGNGNGNGNIRPQRNSLRDRFKVVRLREEAGITSLGDENGEEPPITTVIGRKGSKDLGVTSPFEKPTSPSGLAPGTASGVNAGPQENQEVDWDLWQSVVNEGPAAVARSSPEELNQAIASGIPAPVRGVVWQVMAQSKNENLEAVYRELLARGTDQDINRSSFSSAIGSGSMAKTDKSNSSSSASSVHSDNSTAIPKPSPTSPSERDPEIIAKNAAAALTQRKKKAKEDAAALQKLEKTIKRDLGARTSFSKFAASAGLQDGLFGVCKAYALFDPEVGYAQGMNFLVMPLLFNMPEEEAFCLLVRLMNQYHLRDLFVYDMPGLHKHLYQFERLLEDFEPALYCHLKRRGVTPHLYATQWFLTLFAYRFPLQLVLRIYDLIISEGLEAILKFGICLMQKNAKALLDIKDMLELTNFLKDRLFDVYIDKTPSAGSILESGFFGSSGASIDKEVYRADMLVRDACAVEITPVMIATYTVEWEEQTRAEKEKEAELEGLKATVQTQAAKIRNLEGRLQEHDQEHAALATDLVRTKVREQELEEKIEELTTTVEEQAAVIERQPAEIEERFTVQLETLAKRSHEVHGEHARLEEELAETEAKLVEAKMACAESQAAHETDKRTLKEMRITLRKMMGAEE